MFYWTDAKSPASCFIGEPFSQGHTFEQGHAYNRRFAPNAQERWVMSEQHVELLKKARERLVEDRRKFAKIIAAPFEREKTSDARARFIEMQMAIEAVDRAIEDEEEDDTTV
jgi:hypothetical protein